MKGGCRKPITGEAMNETKQLPHDESACVRLNIK